MEMCYDGALVMPNNYAVVNEEEMTYVDGGKRVKSYTNAAGALGHFNTIVGMSYLGTAACFSIGFLATKNLVLSALAAAVGDYWMQTWREQSNSAISQVYDILESGCGSTRVEITTDTNFLGECTGISVRAI